MEELHVDGDRPAVARLTALPHSWLNEGEWRVLMVLALDSYDGELCKPGYDNIARWAHLDRAAAVRIMKRLTKPNARRPSLIARELTTGGGNRTVWRLLLPEPVSGAHRSSDDQSSPQPVRDDIRYDRSPSRTGKGVLTGDEPVPGGVPHAPVTGVPRTPPPKDTLNPLVAEVVSTGDRASELPGQTDVYEQIAEIEPRRELHLADPPQPDATGLELLTGRAPCPNPAHSPRFRKGAWHCPQCLEARRTA